MVGGVSFLGETVSLGRRALTIGVFTLAASVPVILYTGLLMRLVKTAVVV